MEDNETVTTDGWFAHDELDAMIRSSAYPAEEIDQPDCNETSADSRGHVWCTRAKGHSGRHMAAMPGRLEGHFLFAVMAAWPGRHKPTEVDR